MSVAIPLTAVAVRSRKARRQIFFRELLPEGRMLTRLAQQASLIGQDAIGLLRAYGRDIAQFASNLLAGRTAGTSDLTKSPTGARDDEYHG